MSDGQIRDDFMPEHTTYRVEDVTHVELDPETIVAPLFTVIFEEKPGDWPVKRDWALYQA